jgi:hypothetical protein
VVAVRERKHNMNMSVVGVVKRKVFSFHEIGGVEI